MNTPFKILLIILLFTMLKMNAQQENPLRQLPPEKRKEMLQNLSPQQKMDLLQKQREKQLLEQLSLPKEKEEAFLEVLNEYHESQRKIHQKNEPAKPPHLLTDEEAKQEIKKNYEMGKELLENRRIYTEKFLKIISAKQLLKMFHQERKFMEKVNQHKNMRNNE